jgi:hypothetical protein
MLPTGTLNTVEVAMDDVSDGDVSNRLAVMALLPGEERGAGE